MTSGPSDTHTAGPVTARILLPDQSAVRARGLVVRREGSRVLDGLDLAIERNRCTGLAGHDAPARQALCQVIAARARPHDGNLTVLGHDTARDPYAVRAQLGYLPAPFGLPAHLHLEEYLRARAASQGVPRERWPGLAETLLTLVGLGGRQRLWTHELPPGQRQLLGIAGTLVHDPTVVLLEEPTAGLDTHDRSRIWHLLHRLLDVSRTVIVSSENLGELVTGCQDLAVIDGGHLVAQGPPAEVVAELGGARRIRVRLTNGAIRTHTVADLAAQAALLRKLVEAGLDIAEFTEVPPGLDDLHLGLGETHR